MSLLSRLFGKKKEEDYETILATLASDIQNRQVKLSEIRLRERRSTLLVTLYALAAWVAYVSLWYMNILPNIRRRGERENGPGRVEISSVERALRGVPVVLGPILILFVRRIVQVWYKRKGDAEEKTLQGLMKEQRTKVEEIKKKTNYYSTRDLIQKYDEGTPMDPLKTPLRQRVPVPPSQASTPQRKPLAQSTNTRLQTPVNPNPKNALSPYLAASPQQFPSTPPRKQWYDKLADALLGDDEQAAGPVSSRYALICEKCFAHNGLVKESMWEDAQYLCMKCGHFNPSARSKKLGAVSQNQSAYSSPISPSSSSQTHHVGPHATGADAPAQSQRRRKVSPMSNESSASDERGGSEPPTVDGADVSLMEVDS